MLTVVPVTSNVDRVLPFQVLLPSAESGLRRDSKAQAERVRSVALERIGPAVGRLSWAAERDTDDALCPHLAI